MRLGFIGLGSAGKALARAMARAGIEIAGVASRDRRRAAEIATELPGCQAMTSQEAVDRVDIVFLTVPDDQIEPVCDSLRWRAGAAAVHCSGALPATVLDSAARAGAMIGSCHPLQVLTGGPNDAELLAGSWFGIKADEPLRSELTKLVEAIGGYPISVSAEGKALYHASAMFAAGGVVALVAAAADIWETFGHGREDGLAALLPLVTGAVTQLQARGLPGALSGPMARGDAGTVERHLAAMSETTPELIPLYRELGRLMVGLSRELGRADPASLDQIVELLQPVNERPLAPDQP
ncbi:MAG TPA: DUF2520 domain-containing protein [Thermomicrobiaceae bacterium]|nr:DUF2520 domain-containing protein [Thermomicrobiaceae bacterium]